MAIASQAILPHLFRQPPAEARNHNIILTNIHYLYIFNHDGAVFGQTLVGAFFALSPFIHAKTLHPLFWGDLIIVRQHVNRTIS